MPDLDLRSAKTSAFFHDNMDLLAHGETPAGPTWNHTFPEIPWPLANLHLAKLPASGSCNKRVVENHAFVNGLPEVSVGG